MRLKLAPDKPKKLVLKPKVRREWHEQREVFSWAKLHECRYPQLRLLNASMNGLPVRSPRDIMIAKLCGMRPGYPDLFLPVQGYAGCPGLYIELKRRDYRRAKTPTDTERLQDWWREQLEDQGFVVVTCCGAERAIERIKQYLEMQ